MVPEGCQFTHHFRFKDGSPTGEVLVHSPSMDPQRLSIFTSAKFNSSHLKLAIPKGEDCLPTIIFQGRVVKLQGLLGSTPIYKPNFMVVWNGSNPTGFCRELIKTNGYMNHCTMFLGSPSSKLGPRICCNNVESWWC